MYYKSRTNSVGHCHSRFDVSVSDSHAFASYILYIIEDIMVLDMLKWDKIPINYFKKFSNSKRSRKTLHSTI